MDKYQDVRNIPLGSVLAQLGFTGFKKRPGKKEWFGKCPFHDAKKNKTSFSFDDRRFNCFSCGEHGSGSIDLVMKLKKIGFQEAVSQLSTKQSPVEVTALTANQDTASNNACEKVHENKSFSGTYEKFFVKSDWLKARGLSEETLKLFGVGEYRNPSRKSIYTGKVLFRIPRFKDGACVGYLARTIEPNSEDPKYIFPKISKQLELFGAWHLKVYAQQQGLALPLRVGFVVESPLCVMKYWQLGLYAVSPWGAYVSEEQVAILAQLFRGIVFLPDRDKAEKVAESVKALSSRLWVKAPVLPSGIDDPEKLSPEQIAVLVKS